MAKDVKQEPDFDGPAPGHKALNDADPLAFQASHRRSVFLLRLCVAVIIIMGIGHVSMVQLIYNLFPLKTVEVALIRADPESDKIYRIEPISKQVGGFYLNLESISREFVRLLLTIDEITQNQRFRDARIYADAGFFNRFIQRQEKTIKAALKDGLNRSITIETANQVDAYNGVYQYAVDFVRTDQIGNEEPVTRKLRAYLELTTRPHEVGEQEKYNNPFGVRVIDLVVKERETQ